MDVNAILDWCEEMAEKYSIADADMAALQDILNGISEDDIYGEAEYAEDEDYAEIPDEE